MKRILWIGLLVLIIPSMVAFVGFGTGDMSTGGRAPSEAARIQYPEGSTGVITPLELRAARTNLDRQLQRYAQNKGIMLNDLALSELSNNQAVLDHAINLDILRNFAEVNGITASTEEVIQDIQAQTTADQRRMIMESWRMQGLSPEAVIEDERKSRIIMKATDAIGEKVRVTYYEAWKQYSHERESLVVDFVRFNHSDYLSSVSVTQDGLNAYYEENKENFRIPDQITYDYVLVRKDDLKSSITLSEDEITSYYTANQEDFRLPRQIEASQIFLKIPTADELNTTSPAEITSATLAVTKSANDIYERAAKGEDFASLANTYTQEENFPPRADAGTTASEAVTNEGGNLGRISEDIAKTWYGDEWTSAVVQASPGSITRPIRTAQGYAIVQVRNIIEGDVQPLNEVRPVVENTLRDQKAEPLFEEIGERLQELADSESHNLQRFAEITSTTIQRTPPVGEADNFVRGIGMLGEFKEALEYLEKGEVSDLLSDTQRHLLVKIAEEFPAHVPPLDQIQARVEQAYKIKLAEDKARENAEALLTQSPNHAAFLTAVSNANTTITTSRPFTRPEVPAIFGGHVENFSRETANLEKGSIHLSAVSRPGSPSSYVVWHAAQITPPSRAEFSAELSETVTRLKHRKQEILVLEFLRDQRQKLQDRIEINRDIF